MAQKIVSFEVAKALKEAGYPQGNTLGKYAAESYYDYDQERELKEGEYSELFMILGIDAPTYIDVWLWLWRGKEIRICLEDAWDLQEPEIERGCYVGTNQLGGICSSKEFADPEEAIVDIINYLIENKLIK